ncbi:hypothetical protein KIL84_002546 [Mauremys mutica]|uniref:Uncharacterized protein n=1 Tax=Mauremys mutica TaxID=74926 RepID=A0A9D4ASE3_9SAUR|nr:hypothetical protein KIL84_002546 [Mauremys mutica]
MRWTLVKSSTATSEDNTFLKQIAALLSKTGVKNLYYINTKMAVRTSGRHKHRKYLQRQTLEQSHSAPWNWLWEKHIEHQPFRETVGKSSRGCCFGEEEQDTSQLLLRGNLDCVGTWPLDVCGNWLQAGILVSPIPGTQTRQDNGWREQA